MDRRLFVKASLAIGTLATLPGYSDSASIGFAKDNRKEYDITPKYEREADLIIIGGGMGGCATALAACRNGLKVIMTEETGWIGGQVSTQGVPPDEHQWIETIGAPASYREYRRRVRDYYKSNYPMTDAACQDPFLNPGSGGVSRICHEPFVSVQVLLQLLLPFVSTGHLRIIYYSKPVAAEMSGNSVSAIVVRNIHTNFLTALHGKYFADATDLGELLPLTGTEYVTGAESQEQTGEFHAPAVADPTCNQAFTYCFAMDYINGENHVIEKPKDYEYWRNFTPRLQPAWAPGKLLCEDYVYPSNPSKLSRAYFNPLVRELGRGFDWWNYRKIINKDNFVAGTYPSDVTMVNWPQNDYFDGNLIDVSESEYVRNIEASKQLSLSLLYWLQTECPRRDGKIGWPGLRLRGDIFGTEDGLALAPYIRESRRIKALMTVTEAHVGKEQRLAETGLSVAAKFNDSVGIGYYHIDLHPSCSGVSYIDTGCLQFQIPLGALIPVRVENLLPVCKNIGTTHITNGCYRLHPVEWSIGEAVGCLVAYAMSKSMLPREVREDKKCMDEFQCMIVRQGVTLDWHDS